MVKNKPLVLIMCGGQSLRLWPLSQYKSKNFIDIFGFSPLELTIKRYLKIIFTRELGFYYDFRANRRYFVKR